MLDTVPSEISRDNVHPELPGEATTAEMIRSFWPFTAGRRGQLAVALVLSLVQFGIAAALPLLTGELLSSALRSTTASDAVEQYTSDWLERARSTAELIGELAPLSDDPDSTAAGIRAASALQDVGAARSVLDDLFPGRLVYDTSGAIGRTLHRQVGESDEEWVVTALAAADDGSVDRAELVRLGDSERMSDQRAFEFLVGSLALDDSAAEQRQGEQTRLLVTAIAVFAAAVTALAAVRFLSATVSRWTLLRSGRSLQDAVFAQVHESALLSSGLLPRPSMVSRCTVFVDRVVAALRRLVTTGVPAVMNLVLSIALLLWIDVRIGTTMAATVVLFELARRAATRSWSGTVRRQIDLSTVVGEAVDEAVTVERSTRLVRAADVERHRFGLLSESLRATASRLGAFATGFDVAALLVGQVGVVIITAIVGITRTGLTVGQATAAVLYAQAVAAAIAAIPPVAIELQEAAPYMRRLQRVLLSPTRRTEPVAPLEPPSHVEEVIVDSVETVDLDGQVVLRGVSFAARRGVVVAIMGASADEVDHLTGALGGLEIPTRGAVTVGGVPLAAMADRSLRRLVHVMPRVSPLYPTSLANNVTLGEPARHSVEATMSQSGLDDFAGGLVERIESAVSADRRRISGESIARLGLARAVSATADVIVIEDPTQVLDREAAVRWWQVLRSSLADRVVIVLTDQVDVLRDDDVVVMMRAGEVVENGSRHALLEKGRWFSQLWKRGSASAGDALDLGALPMLAGLDREALDAVADRMVTERYEAGDPIYVPGEPADRVFMVLDGRVDIVGSGRRIASVGPGGYFGDVTLEHQELRAVTARARGPVVVRSLHRLAVSPGLVGVIDRSPEERRVMAYLTRRGEAHLGDIRQTLADIDVDAALAALMAARMVIAGGEPDSFRPAPSSRRPRAGSVLPPQNSLLGDEAPADE